MPAKKKSKKKPGTTRIKITAKDRARWAKDERERARRLKRQEERADEMVQLLREDVANGLENIEMERQRQKSIEDLVVAFQLIATQAIRFNNSTRGPPQPTEPGRKPAKKARRK